ncbi:MAG: 50S ribosomal protein L37ae [Candidatus Hadarchaeales archaeon]
MGKAKEGAATGGFGPRYGFTLRRRYAEIASKARQKYKCPSCSEKKLRRVSTGVWQCQKCGAKFAGGAYTPSVKELEKAVKGDTGAKV